jgi:hypothetical protein
MLVGLDGAVRATNAPMHARNISHSRAMRRLIVGVIPVRDSITQRREP